MGSEDSQPSESSVLHGNDAFVNKLLSRKSTSSGQSLRRERDYYCEEPGVVPFIWEVQPGIPKDPPNDHHQTFLPLPPTASPRLKLPKQKPSSSTPTATSCFLNKHKKSRHESRSPKFFHSGNSSTSDDDFFSSPCVSAKGSPSSKALATTSLPSSIFRSLAKGLLRRFF